MCLYRLVLCLYPPQTGGLVQGCAVLKPPDLRYGAASHLTLH